MRGEAFCWGRRPQPPGARLLYDGSGMDLLTGPSRRHAFRTAGEPGAPSEARGHGSRRRAGRGPAS